MEIYSSKKSKIEDGLGNIFELESFKFNINEKLLKAKILRCLMQKIINTIWKIL